MSRCGNFHVTTAVHEEYTRAVADAQRERFKGVDHPDLRAAVARVQAASDRFHPCVLDPLHPLPHRDAEGNEWGHPVEEPETVEIEVPDADTIADWLREMEESYDNHDAAPEMTTSIDIDIDTLAERFVEWLREQA